MKTPKITLLLSFLLIAGSAYAQTDSAANVKKANKWVKSHIWAKDLKIKPDPSINSVEFERQYERNKESWDKAFAYLGDEKLSTIAPGKYPIDGDNVFAIITLGDRKSVV